MSLTRRFFGWLGDRVFDAMGERLEGLNAPASPAPADPEDEVEERPEDEGLLGPEATSMLAEPEASVDPVDPKPLEGSAEERFARLRLR